MFLYLSVVFIGFLILVYFIRLFSSPFVSLAENSLALVNTLLLKIDEDEKVALVQKQNAKLILSLFKVVASILLAVLVASIPFVIYLILSNKTYQDLDFTSLASILTLSIGSTLGFFIPIKRKNTEGYSELSKLLHRMALNNYAIAYKLFKKEAKKLSKKGIKIKPQFVIVSGLARSGTTSLMNRLSENKVFRSLDYSNMPFLTAPNVWKKFYNPKGNEKKERSHNDGIMIGLESNEALEEYFLKILENDSYINENALESYELTEENYKDYIKYQAVVRNNNESIYLAKNNNFLLRYESIRKLNADFLIVFMYREPLSHAASLLEKHKQYSKMQKEDPFVLEYMNWLGHHEFGLNQKPFQFSDSKMSFNEDKLNLDYWLQVWINYYSYLLTIQKENVLFIDYDIYCNEPNQVLESIYRKLKLKVDGLDFQSFENKREVNSVCSQELQQKALKIYKDLKLSTTA